MSTPDSADYATFAHGALFATADYPDWGRITGALDFVPGQIIVQQSTSGAALAFPVVPGMLLMGNCTTGNVVITPPKASELTPGMEFAIKRVDSTGFSVEIACRSGDLINQRNPNFFMNNQGQLLEFLVQFASGVGVGYYTR